MVDGLEIDNMVMYVTEELLYRDEKFISREDDDGTIAHYNNVRLTCPAEDSHCVGGDFTYIWCVALKTHCPLYHVRKFKGQMINPFTLAFAIRLPKSAFFKMTYKIQTKYHLHSNFF